MNEVLEKQNDEDEDCLDHMETVYWDHSDEGEEYLDHTEVRQDESADTGDSLSRVAGRRG